VAVVDDEKDIVLLFRDALSQIDGCTVFGFTDPQVALEHFITNQQFYYLILTDFRMPTLTGIQLIMKMNEIKPSIRAVLVSAFEMRDEEIFQQCMKKNIINGFLQKPIAMNDLIDEVKNQIGQKDDNSYP
jgi:DNA-binding NtrC family response regulator